jgi:hypothetical protein
MPENGVKGTLEIAFETTPEGGVKTKQVFRM